MRHASCAILVLMIGFGPAAAQIGSLELHTPRAFGYFLGDRIHHRIEAVVDAPYALRRAALPAPQALTYWLDLVDIAVEADERGERNRYVVDLTYQTFYAPLAATRLEIPAFRVAFGNGETVVARSVPAWSFVSSSLRGFQPRVTGGATFIRPDITPATLDTRPPRRRAAWFMLAGAIAGGLALHHWALWPFGARPRRPFTAAARRIAALGPTDQDYRCGLECLHRAIDEAAGTRLLAQDFPAWLERSPAFAPATADVARFFTASSRAFFAEDTQGAMAVLPPGDLQRLATRLGALERSAS